MLNKNLLLCYNQTMIVIKEFRRSMVLSLNEDGEVVIKAPFFLSKKKIEKFYLSKQKWISKQRERINKSKETSNQYDFKNNVYIDGIGYKWDEIKKGRQTKSSFYSKYFYENIVKKAQNYAKVEIKLCNSKTIWGSCNYNKTIKLNWKIVLLAPHLQNYIIVHEVCHLKQMNHSKLFWNEVEKLDPNYKQNRKELKDFSFLLRQEVLL